MKHNVKMEGKPVKNNIQHKVIEYEDGNTAHHYVFENCVHTICGRELTEEEQAKELTEIKNALNILVESYTEEINKRILSKLCYNGTSDKVL